MLLAPELVRRLSKLPNDAGFNAFWDAFTTFTNEDEEGREK